MLARADDPDYIQDPATGRFQGSHGHGGAKVPNDDEAITPAVHADLMSHLPEEARTEDGAERYFTRELTKMDPLFYHEGPGDFSASVRTSGITAGSGGSPTVFARVSEPSQFAISPIKTVVSFKLTPTQLREVAPDMRYGWSDKLSTHQLLLLEHPHISGADVDTNQEKVAATQVKSVTARASLEVDKRPITFTKPARAEKDTMVLVDTAAFDKEFAKDEGAYIGPGGTGNTISSRYQQFETYLSRTTRVEVPEVAFVPKGQGGGQVRFVNGRHRYAVLRDHGLKTMPIAVSPESMPHLREMGIMKAAPRWLTRAGIIHMRGGSHAATEAG